MVDLLWSPRLTKENFSRYIELENFEETARDTGPERSVMIACYHYSNFEWLSLACGFLDLKGTIISQEFKNSSLDPIFKKIAGAIRSRAGATRARHHAALQSASSQRAARRCWSISQCRPVKVP